MVKVKLGNIQTLNLDVLAGERTVDSKGELAIHPDVAKTYLEKGFDKLPVSASKIGEKYSIESGSFPVIDISGNDVNAKLIKTRFAFGEAHRITIAKAQEKGVIYMQEEICGMAPNMANASVIAVTEYKGQPYMLTHRKGMDQIGNERIGSGQLIGALAAGAVNAKYLINKDPLKAATIDKTKLDIGFNLKITDSPFLLIDESELGTVNFAYLKKVELNDVCHAYEINLEGKDPKKMAATGLLLVPLDAQVNQRRELTDILSPICLDHEGNFHYGHTFEKIVVRPYTQALLDYTNVKENRETMVERIGGF